MKTSRYDQKERNKLSKSHRKVSSNLQVRNTPLTFPRPKKDGGSAVTDEESRQNSGRFFLKIYRMYSMCAGLLLLLVTLSAVSAAELVQYGQCSLNFTQDKIINLRKSKELGGAVFLSSFSSDSLEDCSHSCCEDTAGQCSVAVYHDDTNMDNCYHINCPDPQSCVYQELAGYTLAVISRAIPQAEALGGTTTEKPATVTTKTTSTKAPEVIPQGRMFNEKQQETTTVTTKAQVKLSTEHPSTAAKQQTTTAKQPGTPQEMNPATEEQQQPTEQPKSTGSQQQQQTSTKPSTQLTTITRTTTTPKSLTTQTFTQKQTTKTATTTTTTVVSKATTKVDESVQTTQASKTSEAAVEEVKQTTQPMVVPTQAPTSKVQTIPPTNPPETQKPSPSPLPSTKPTTTTSKKTQAVTVKTNPVPEATVAQTKASSTGKSPDVTAEDTQPPTTKPTVVTTKKLMPGSTAKEEEVLTQASLVQGSLGPQVANRNESVTAADKMGKSSYGSLIVAMCFGLLFLFAVVVVVGKRWYESWQRRHYSKIDYLINGMYN